LKIDLRTLTDLIAIFAPNLSAHLEKVHISLPLILTKWMLCLFITTLQTHVYLRILDNFFLDGRLVMFRIAVALVTILTPRIQETNDPIKIVRILQEG
jgi:hypothetical protein